MSCSDECMKLIMLVGSNIEFEQNLEPHRVDKLVVSLRNVIPRAKSACGFSAEREGAALWQLDEAERFLKEGNIDGALGAIDYIPGIITGDDGYGGGAG